MTKIIDGDYCLQKFRKLMLLKPITLHADNIINKYSTVIIEKSEINFDKNYR